jgi:hypothetical protein
MGVVWRRSLADGADWLGGGRGDEAGGDAGAGSAGEHESGVAGGPEGPAPAGGAEWVGAAGGRRGDGAFEGEEADGVNLAEVVESFTGEELEGGAAVGAGLNAGAGVGGEHDAGAVGEGDRDGDGLRSDFIARHDGPGGDALRVNGSATECEGAGSADGGDTGRLGQRHRGEGESEGDEEQSLEVLHSVFPQRNVPKGQFSAFVRQIAIPKLFKMKELYDVAVLLYGIEADSVARTAGRGVDFSSQGSGLNR